jgi:hypothetical protein
VNAIRQILGLAPIPIAFDLTEVLLGEVSPLLAGYGFTVMDGPFWSLMPFGHSGLMSLTNVGLTPLVRNESEPKFPCQLRRTGCEPLRLSECTTCLARPQSAGVHQVQQLSIFLKEANYFQVKDRLLTVKATLKTTEADDARPTLIQRDSDINVWTVLSGKVSSLFDLEQALA